jgi:hypothetical protein
MMGRCYSMMGCCTFMMMGHFDVMFGLLDDDMAPFDEMSHPLEA